MERFDALGVNPNRNRQEDNGCARDVARGQPAIQSVLANQRRAPTPLGDSNEDNEPYVEYINNRDGPRYEGRINQNQGFDGNQGYGGRFNTNLGYEGNVGYGNRFNQHLGFSRILPQSKHPWLCWPFKY